MLGLKLNLVSKRGHWELFLQTGIHQHYGMTSNCHVFLLHLATQRRLS